MRSLLLLVPLLLSADPAPSPLVRMEVKDVVPLKELKQHAVVLVSKEDGTVLPLFVDETAAVAIAFRLMGRPTPHPLAHDLLDRLIPSLGGRLTEVRIDGLKDHVYQSHVFIQQADRKLVIEARPSDAVSMALAARVPVYTTRQVMAEGGISRAEIDAYGRDSSAPAPGVGGSGNAGASPGLDTPAPAPSPARKSRAGKPVEL